MPEVLIEYDIRIEGPDGRLYGARACARDRADGLWEAWIEFDPVNGEQPIRTGRETTQPNREDVFYWATGLTATYLDGALTRTLKPLPPVEPRVDIRARPAFSGPDIRDQRHTVVTGVTPTAVLDPFLVYGEGADVLRGQLHALSRSQLGNIVKAYGIAAADAATVDAMSQTELVALIMGAVEQRAG